MAKIKRGDRVTIPNDERIYSVEALDGEQGYALLDAGRKVVWIAIAHCSKVDQG